MAAKKAKVDKRALFACIQNIDKTTPQIKRTNIHLAT